MDRVAPWEVVGDSRTPGVGEARAVKWPAEERVGDSMGFRGRDGTGWTKGVGQLGGLYLLFRVRRKQWAVEQRVAFT